jgi:hypothetical protein
MSAKPFLITGLPRSRTAWLSVFMTTGTSMCYHDAVTKIGSIEELPKLFESEFYKHVGISDCSVGFFLEWILENIRPRTVIVDRDPAEVTNSMARLGFPRTNLAPLLHAQLLKFQKHPLVMWIPFEALNRKRVIERMYWHLTPGEAFDEARYEHLAKMRIETDLKRTVEEYYSHKDRLDNLMRDVAPRIKLEQAAHA